MSIGSGVGSLECMHGEGCWAKVRSTVRTRRYGSDGFLFFLFSFVICPVMAGKSYSRFTCIDTIPVLICLCFKVYRLSPPPLSPGGLKSYFTLLDLNLNLTLERGSLVIANSLIRVFFVFSSCLHEFRRFLGYLRVWMG